MKLAIVCLIPDFGHIIPLMRIAQESAKDGHEICFFIPDEAKKLIDEKDMSCQFFGKVVPADGEKSLRRLFDAPPLANRLILRYLFNYDYLVPLKINILSRLDSIKSAVKLFTPDLIIGDATPSFTQAMYTIAADCQVPAILHHAPATNQRSPRIRVARKRYTPRKYVYDLCSKILVFLESTSTRIFAKDDWESRNKRDLILQEYKSQFSQISSCQSGIKMSFVTTGLGALEAKYLGDSIDLRSDMILLGPLPPRLNLPISEDLKKWLEIDGGKPVIFVCFGTLASFSRKVIDEIITSATELNIRLLWASKTNPFRDIDVPGSDMRWECWLPQPAVLSHRAVKGFLSHAGGSSIQEALWFAQPLICVPQMWDQPYNGWVTEKLGFGITIDKNAFKKEKLVNALQKILYDDNFKRRITVLSAEVRAQDGSGNIRALIRKTGRSDQMAARLA